jgi:hypothetical protein
MALVQQILPLVGVLLGAGAAYLATVSNERKKATRELSKDWRVKRTEVYLSYLIAVKKMRLLSGQMAATLCIDDESDPLDMTEGTRLLVVADEARGTAYEYVNVCGDSDVIEKARALNRAVWSLEWVARERHPASTPATWHDLNEIYVRAVDDFIMAVRGELQVPGSYPRRQVEYPHAGMQRTADDRTYRRLNPEQ